MPTGPGGKVDLEPGGGGILPCERNLHTHLEQSDRVKGDPRAAANIQTLDHPPGRTCRGGCSKDRNFGSRFKGDVLGSHPAVFLRIDGIKDHVPGARAVTGDDPDLLPSIQLPERIITSTGSAADIDF